MAQVREITELDELVLDRAREGSDQHFERLVQHHEAMVFSIALRFFQDRTTAEDVAQDVFLQLYRRIGEIEDTDHLTGWLRKVTCNRCIDLQRRLRPLVSDVLDEQPARSDSSDPILRRMLRALVAQLSPTQRLVVTLRYQEDLGVDEIAETLEMPSNTVKSHLRRALQTLREQVASPRSPRGSGFTVRRVSL